MTPTYENPPPAEGINTTNEHPLKEFSQLLLGIGAVVIVILVVLNFAAGALAKRIPFEYEVRMAQDIEFGVQNEDQQAKLQQLADILIKHMDLPDEMAVSLHYDSADIVNAYATLGGNVVFFQGLLDEIKDEQALAAVMAHEIAHIKHRHPITALGKGLSIAAFAAFTGGFSGSSAGEWLIGSTANLGLMKFSRDQEREADREAARALNAVYGNIGGTKILFEHFQALEQQASTLERGLGSVEVFRSHPFSIDRWQELAEFAQQNGWALD